MGGRDGGSGVWGGCALRFHHRLIGLHHAIPALVPVHRKIAPDNGGDAHARHTIQICFKALQIIGRRARRRIPPIGEAVNSDRNART